MNKKLLLFIFFFISTSLFAEKYKVLYVSSSDIVCGGTIIASADTISDSDEIDWGNSSSPYMIVKNLATKQQRKLSGPEMKQEGFSVIKSFQSWIDSFNIFYFRTNKTSTQSIPAKLLQLDIIEDTYYIDDSICIETALPTDTRKRFFSLRSGSIACKLKTDSNGFIVVSKQELIGNKLVKGSQKKVTLKLEYKNPNRKDVLSKELMFIMVD